MKLKKAIYKLLEILMYIVIAIIAFPFVFIFIWFSYLVISSPFAWAMLGIGLSYFIADQGIRAISKTPALILHWISRSTNEMTEKERTKYYLITAVVFSLVVSGVSIHLLNKNLQFSNMEKNLYFSISTLLLIILPSGWRAVYPSNSDPTKVKTPIMGKDFIGEPIRAGVFYILFKMVFMLIAIPFIGILSFLIAPFAFVMDLVKVLK